MAQKHKKDQGNKRVLIKWFIEQDKFDVQYNLRVE